MKRPWQIWIVYALCFGVVLSAMGWVSMNVLRLEKLSLRVQERAAYEETIRLALWRMDSAITPLIIEESSRPYYEYNAFNKANVVYPNALNGGTKGGMIPSTLLGQTPSNIVVYFNGLITDTTNILISSPQVPTGSLEELALGNFDISSTLGRNNDNFVTFTNAVSMQDLLTNIASINMDQQSDYQLVAVNDVENQTDMPDINLNIAHPPANSGDTEQQAIIQNQPYQVLQGEQQGSPLQSAANNAPMTSRQQSMNAFEYDKRGQQIVRAQSRIVSSKQEQYEFQKSSKPSWKNRVSSGKGKVPGFVKGNANEADDWPEKQSAVPEKQTEISEDIMRPLWINDLLLLARYVNVDGSGNIQGAWLNWDNIRSELLAEISDLFPAADLVPVKSNDSADRSRMLATLPARLVPGIPAVRPSILQAPLSIPLLIAWCCVLLAAAAVGLLLVGVVTLSERRGAFVSAVTHELRTPLTTFRIYSEMLAEGMIKDRAKEKVYLDTLCAEGNRLSHLVENVLSFARIERKKAGRQREQIEVTALLDRFRDRLQQRAEQSNMILDVDVGDVGERQVSVDISAVEQILFNLVDNAAKYAAKAVDPCIHLRARITGRKLHLQISDHGPGIARQESRRLFRAFCKSAQHAAESAPGVGLGLALSRRLARQMGGDLTVDTTIKDGACFDLVIPF